MISFSLFSGIVPLDNEYVYTLEKNNINKMFLVYFLSIKCDRIFLGV